LYISPLQGQKGETPQFENDIFQACHVVQGERQCLTRLAILGKRLLVFTAAAVYN
jgi:hypothetical protein